MKIKRLINNKVVLQKIDKNIVMSMDAGVNRFELQGLWYVGYGLSQRPYSSKLKNRKLTSKLKIYDKK